METERATIEIIGLCDHGAVPTQLEQALSGVIGVAHAYVNVVTETAYVRYDPRIATTDDLVAAIVKSGYAAGVPNVR